MVIKYRKVEGQYETYNVIVQAGEDLSPTTVGRVFSNLKGGWYLTAYFDYIFIGGDFLKTKYDDMTEAGRALVAEWQYHHHVINNGSGGDTLDEFYIGDLFK